MMVLERAETPLALVRLPGPRGPILRCRGDLTVATMEPLRRELALLTGAGHEALILNLSAVGELDVDAAIAVLDAARAIRVRGGRLVLVASGDSASTLRALGVDRALPLFPSELEALARVEGDAPAPVSWADARHQSAAQWERLLERAGTAPPDEIAHDLTSMFALCGRAEAARLQPPAYGLDRCQFCPLFYALGGQSANIGCGDTIDRLLEKVRRGDRDGLQREITAIIRVIRSLPLPEEPHGHRPPPAAP